MLLSDAARSVEGRELQRRESIRNGRASITAGKRGRDVSEESAVGFEGHESFKWAFPDDALLGR
jgi:hypothetical protein